MGGYLFLGLNKAKSADFEEGKIQNFWGCFNEQLPHRISG
jgi:hypothetical protein